MVLISAGTSVGEKDLIPTVLKSLEEPGMLVHGVSLRPGYPTGLAVIDGKPVISLPGYPVSNAVAFRVFAKPLIARILGTVVDVEPIVRAKMARRVATPGGLRTFVRVKISRSEDGLTAEPIMASGAGVISSLTEADALLIIPEDSEGVDEGEEVELRLLRPIKVE
jgi:molybdopterin biosynthesis enzyme